MLVFSLNFYCIVLYCIVLYCSLIVNVLMRLTYCLLFKIHLIVSEDPVNQVWLNVELTPTALIVIMHLLGKVHGSLARAGKVKGQTPKVCIFNFVFELNKLFCILCGLFINCGLVQYCSVSSRTSRLIGRHC